MSPLQMPLSVPHKGPEIIYYYGSLKDYISGRSLFIAICCTKQLIVAVGFSRPFLHIGFAGSAKWFAMLCRRQTRSLSSAQTDSPV
jgi:hypothetical protein